MNRIYVNAKELDFDEQSVIEDTCGIILDKTLLRYNTATGHKLRSYKTDNLRMFFIHGKEIKSIKEVMVKVVVADVWKTVFHTFKKTGSPKYEKPLMVKGGWNKALGDMTPSYSYAAASNNIGNDEDLYPKTSKHLIRGYRYDPTTGLYVKPVGYRPSDYWGGGGVGAYGY